MTRYLVAGALVVCCLIAGVWFLPSAQATGDEANPESSVRTIVVNVAEAKKVDSVDQLREFTGSVKARRESLLAFERAGRVTAINVDEGDQVREGQLLATLDVELVKAQREAAKASLDQAKAVLSELEAGPREQTIAASQARVRSLTAVANRIDKDLNRANRLLETRAISQERFDTVQFQSQGAISELDAAQKRLDELEAGTRIEQVVAQRATVQSMSAQLKQFDLDIEDGELRAPFGGRIAERLMDEGSVVSPGSTVLQLVEDEHVEAWVGLPPETALFLNVGDSHEVEVGRTKFEAKLTSLRPLLDPVTRTRNAIFELRPETEINAVPGEIARLHLTEKVDCVGFQIPSAALVPGARGLWDIYVVDASSTPNVVERRSVELLYTLGDESVVTGTVGLGDAIIIDGTHRIVNGQAVEVRRARQSIQAGQQHE